MSACRFDDPFARAFLLATALGAGPAAASDLAPTPETARKLQDVFAAAGAASFLTAKPEGDGYLVCVDLAALNWPAEDTEASPKQATIVLRAIEQDDGNWRVALVSLPDVAFRSKETKIGLAFETRGGTTSIDPSLAALLSGSKNLVRQGLIKARTPTSEHRVGFGAERADLATTASGDSSGWTTVAEAAKAAFAISGIEWADTRGNLIGGFSEARVKIGLDGVRAREALGLLSLLAAHPARAGLARGRRS